jgi:hypothetical protein
MPAPLASNGSSGLTTRFTLDVARDVHNRFKSICARHGTTMSYEINALIAQQLADHHSLLSATLYVRVSRGGWGSGFHGVSPSRSRRAFFPDGAAVRCCIGGTICHSARGRRAQTPRALSPGSSRSTTPRPSCGESARTGA